MKIEYPSQEFEGPKIVSTQIMELRKEYSLAALDEDTIEKNPFVQFEKWFQEAINAQLTEPNAMHLSTVNPDGKPSGRIVLLKGLIDNQFIFYTNYESPKAIALSHQPFAAITFFWPELERQIRIEGIVSKLSSGASYEYFKLRPRESQISAWASPQSQVVNSRKELEASWAAIQEKFKDIPEIPLPPNWGGYGLSPSRFEFWQGRKNRLHDRFLYIPITDNSWKIQRLAP
ncbi:MAG: pyridoxamine 5'-phosphate oxidase [Bacteroidia bacterium]|nr:pyridoxamine 5'-phosphate oxidase [Bacteroidia bacterium]MDW8159059.1 pyridoxamine 5'-phosphate oxidase [Bacteroidia bacterium]